jgi:hypothetical protein
MLARCMLLIFLSLAAAFNASYARVIPGPPVPTIDEFSENVVRLTVQRSNGSTDVGFGLLVFVKENRLFVATADHVLRGNSHTLTPTKIVVYMHEHLNRKPMEVTSIPPIFDASLDVACFEISNLGDTLQFSPNTLGWSASLPLARGSNYYFIGRNETWYVPTKPAVFNSTSPLGGYVFDQADVQPGSSGAPLYNEEDGLVAGLVREKLGSDSAVAVSFTDVLRVLRKNSVEPKYQRQSISLTYDNARSHGVRYIERRKTQLEAQSASESVSAGEAFYEGPVVFDVNEDGVLDWVQIWTLSGAGGGNHDEQYASIFLGVSPYGVPKPYSDEPNYVAQIGSRGGKKVELNLLKRPDIEVDESQFAFVLPGCKKSGRDTMSGCSTRGDRLFVFCQNMRQSLISVGFEEYRDQYPARNFSGIESILGVSLTKKKIWVALGDNTIADSGLAPHRTYTAFEIGQVYEKGQKIGLKQGDYIVSINGKTADTPSGLTCSVGAELAGELDDLSGKHFVIYRSGENKILQLNVPDVSN